MLTKKDSEKVKRLTQLFLLFLCGFFSSCSKGDTSPSQVPTVAVSIPPYLSLVKEIVGDTMIVHSVLGPNFDPHTAETTPHEMALTQNADLFVAVGEGYEKKLLTALSDAKKTVHVLSMNDEVPLLTYSDTSNLIDPCHHHTGHHIAPSEDLHFWLGPKELMIQVETLVKALSKLKPENDYLYQKRGLSLIKKIQSLDSRLETALRPYKEKSIVTSHASLGYFCHDYHLTQIAIECEGKSPLPQQITRIYHDLEHSNVICVFTSPQFNNRGAEMVAKELNLRVESFDPLAEDVLATIEQIASDITK